MDIRQYHNVGSFLCIILVSAVCIGCSSTPAARVISRYPVSCTARPGPLPDPACTPGARNPDVRPETIGHTICSSGWTATIRPPTSVTAPIKKSAIRAYGLYAGGAANTYELDHLIPLELGGAPRDPANLWPEPGIPNPKDQVENAARRAVCNGHMSLSAAQNAIATDWTALAGQLKALGHSEQHRD